MTTINLIPDLESKLAAMTAERDELRARLERAEQQLCMVAGTGLEVVRGWGREDSCFTRILLTDGRVMARECSQPDWFQDSPTNTPHRLDREPACPLSPAALAEARESYAAWVKNGGGK